MRNVRPFVAVLVLLFSPIGVRAQLFLPPLVPSYPLYNGFRLSYSTRNVSVIGGFGNPYLAWGYGPLSPYALNGFPAARVTVYYSPPPIVIRQPIVVIPERQVEVTEDDEFIRIVPRANKLAPDKAKRDVEEGARPAPMPGLPRGEFRPIEPTDRARAERKERLRPRIQPLPQAKPGTRSAAFVAEGRAAFGVQLHGRAERLFECAAKAEPAEPVAPFFIAQARYALRKYREAVEAIETGLRGIPDWPNSPFRADDLYGANVADFSNHLKHLEETLARHPNDPALLFLYSYELWFSGRQVESRAMFLRAAKVTPDRTFIELFLRAPKPEPMARRP